MAKTIKIEHHVASDPVFQDTKGWWFYDETWSHAHGPFATELRAREELARYCHLDLGHEWSWAGNRVSKDMGFWWFTIQGLPAPFGPYMSEQEAVSSLKDMCCTTKILVWADGTVTPKKDSDIGWKSDDVFETTVSSLWEGV